MRSPVSVYLRTIGDKEIWYARFWDDETGRYTASRSTGVPHVARSNKSRDLALKKAEAMLADIRRKSDPLFIDYLTDFWKPEGPYARQKRISENHPLSAQYLGNNQRAIRLHVASGPVLAHVTLSRLKAGQINDWKLWALERGTGRRTVNYALQAIRVAVRQAVERGDLPQDPLAPVKKVAETPRERGVLKPSELENLAMAKEADPRVKAAVLLAAFCGLRRGEVRGLLWGDILESEGIINVVHNYVDGEGAKGCKCGSSRQVALLDIVSKALNEVKAVSPSTAPESFVLFDLSKDTRPISDEVIKDGFVRMLKAIGIDSDEKTRRNLTFHGLRHSFITNARMQGLSDAVVQAMAGHKSPAMMARYSHVGTVIDFNAAKAILEKPVGKKDEEPQAIRSEA